MATQPDFAPQNEPAGGGAARLAELEWFNRQLLEIARDPVSRAAYGRELSR